MSNKLREFVQYRDSTIKGWINHNKAEMSTAMIISTPSTVNTQHHIRYYSYNSFKVFKVNISESISDVVLLCRCRFFLPFLTLSDLRDPVEVGAELSNAICLQRPHH